MSRATGYFAVTNYLGGRFITNDKAMTGFINALLQPRARLHRRRLGAATSPAAARARLGQLGDRRAAVRPTPSTGS